MKIGISYTDRVCFLRTLKQDERAIASARSMQYTRLGSTGMQVSRICLGTMSFGNSEEWMVEIDEGRPLAIPYHGPGEEESQTTADGQNRPLPNSPMGLCHTDRRDARGANRSCSKRNGQLHRRVEHVVLAVC